MDEQLRKISVGELHEKLRALARTMHTFDPNELARLAKDAGVHCTAEDIEAVVRELSSELGEDDLERVAGGCANYDWSKNLKV